MIWWIGLIALFSVVSFFFGHLDGSASESLKARKRERMREKAEEILSELPEEGPFEFSKLIRLKKDPPNPLRSVWRHCTKCGWSYESHNDDLKLCVCSSYDKTHFHLKCTSCGHRMLVRTRDDVDEAPEKVTPSPDNNACECGCSEAKGATMASGVPAWQCDRCGKLRPKLIDGVTPVETN